MGRWSNLGVRCMSESPGRPSAVEALRTRCRGADARAARRARLLPRGAPGLRVHAAALSDLHPVAGECAGPVRAPPDAAGTLVDRHRGGVARALARADPERRAA